MCFDGDPVDLLKTRQTKARTQHRCAECARTIEAGETYLYEAWIYEGGFDTHKTCSHCQAARRWLLEVCSSWQYGAVHADLCEHWDEEPIYRSLGLGRLIVAERTQWERNGELLSVDRVTAWVDDALRHVPALAGAR